MNEFDLIEHYFLSNTENRRRTGSVTDVGNGDDCTVLSHLAGRLAISTDTVVHGRHVPASAPAGWLASRGLGSSVSDLVAMGAKPLGFTLALTLPKVSSGWLKGFSEALFRAADLYGIALLGGDVTRGPLTASYTVFGELPKTGRLLTRASAQLGDKVWVSGTLGAAAGALPLFDQPLRSADRSYRARLQLLQAYVYPAPPVELGVRLQADSRVHAAIDISDGLLADLAHIAKASQLDLNLNASAIPVAPALSELYSRPHALMHAMSGGDDYQVGFTADPTWSIDDRMVSQIGEVMAGTGQVFIDHTPADRWLERLATTLPGGMSLATGYQHFG
ncbi:thiamine-phosphate kinase [Allohahella marinimesophila]|uniref:Thiamine-monophosphate kinase n=1 Tax=Allohahella marinimesophila TaxID=1054972 RepID=A0ABP7PTR3_9GAMM